MPPRPIRRRGFCCFPAVKVRATWVPPEWCSTGGTAATPSGMAGVRSSAVRDLFAAASRPDMISLSGGMPDGRARCPPRRSPPPRARRCMHEGAAALQYGSQRRARRRCATLVAELMAEIGVRLTPDDLIVTAGAQQGLDLLAKIVPRPRRRRHHRGPDVRRRAAGVLGVPARRSVCIPMDDDGMRMDLLEAELQAARPARREVHLHDPELPEPGRRHAVARAPPPAARAGARVRHPRRRGRPVRAAALRGRAHEAAARARRRGHLPRHVLARSSRPGCGSGWMAAPRPILAKVLLAKQAADLCGSQLRAGHRRALLRRARAGAGCCSDLTRTYAERRDAMLAALEEHFPRRGALDAGRRAASSSGSSCPPSSTARRCSPRRSSAA